MKELNMTRVASAKQQTKLESVDIMLKDPKTTKEMRARILQTVEELLVSQKSI